MVNKSSKAKTNIGMAQFETNILQVAKNERKRDKKFKQKWPSNDVNCLNYQKLKNSMESMRPNPVRQSFDFSKTSSDSLKRGFGMSQNYS